MSFLFFEKGHISPNVVKKDIFGGTFLLQKLCGTFWKLNQFWKAKITQGDKKKLM